MPICKKCGLSFPSKIKIDGKERNLQNRKFCLICSPFNLHNTKSFVDEGKSTKLKSGVCCGKINKRKGNKCWGCAVALQRERNFNKIYDKLGGMNCWICGYNRCRQGLDFHHVLQDQKTMQLSAREMQMKWSKIWEEVQKCILVCACCHREIHAKLITQDEIKRLFIDRWFVINQKPTVP